jgi:Mrp family chromosome partitioning ATPase
MTSGSTSITKNPRGLVRRRAALIASVAILTALAAPGVAWLADDSDLPGYPVVVGVGLLAGIGLGLIIAFVWDRYSGRLRSISDVEAATGLPVLALIPTQRPDRIERDEATGSTSSDDSGPYGHLTAGLVGALREYGASCLLVTSPTKKAGRTTIAANLAASFAAEGMRVALVSADSRGHSVDQLLGLRPEPGLMEVLDGSSSLDAALRPTDVARLRVLPAGTPTSHGMVGYNLDDLAMLLDRVTKSVDLVVLEAPPVLGGIETVLLAQEVDLVLLTVDIRRGRSADASLAVSYLGHVEDRLVGCVANDPGRRRARRRGVVPAPIPMTAAAAEGQPDPTATPSKARLRHAATVSAAAIGGAAGATGGALRSAGHSVAAATSLETPRRRRWAGVIATAITVAVVISSVWWVSYDDGRNEARANDQDSPESPLVATATSARSAVDAALEECRSTWKAQKAPLKTAADSLNQWDVHITAMNQLIAGKITLAQANAFWEQTRVQASQKVHRFHNADRRYVGGDHACRTPAVAEDSEVDLSELAACENQIQQRDEALGAARVAIDSWDHHVMDMNQLRAGEISPDRAVRLWLKYWKQGAADLKAYQVQLDRADGDRC